MTHPDLNSADADNLPLADSNIAQGNGSITYGLNLGRAETWVNVFWIVLGFAVCAYSYKLKLYSPIGPATGFFPMLAGVVILVTGIALLAGQQTRVDARLHFWPEQGSLKRVGLVLGGVVALILLMRFLGFIVASVVIMPLMLRAIEARSWRFVIVVGTVSAAIIYVIFDTMLGTILPRSALGF